MRGFGRKTRPLLSSLQLCLPASFCTTSRAARETADRAACFPLPSSNLPIVFSRVSRRDVSKASARVFSIGLLASYSPYGYLHGKHVTLPRLLSSHDLQFSATHPQNATPISDVVDTSRFKKNSCQIVCQIFSGTGTSIFKLFKHFLMPAQFVLRQNVAASGAATRHSAVLGI